MKKPFVIFIFPSCKEKWTIINQKIESYKLIIKQRKIINLSSVGKFNLINNLYKNEDWLGDINNNYDGLYYKLNSCFPSNNNQCLIYFVEAFDTDMKNLKKEIRNLCKIGNHSIHTTDSDDEYQYLLKCYGNENTIKFLNVVKDVIMPNFNILFKKILKTIEDIDINTNQICLSGSSILSVFNLRDCYDLDFFSLNNSINNLDKKIELYNNYYLNSNFYKIKKISIEQIFNDEKNYFYYNGIKFMSLELIKEFKILRNEEKDRKDILLIEEILTNENYRC